MRCPLNWGTKRCGLPCRNDLGMALVNFCRIIPDGLLVFAPSYALLTVSLPTLACRVVACLWLRDCGIVLGACPSLQDPFLPLPLPRSTAPQSLITAWKTQPASGGPSIWERLAK